MRGVLGVIAVLVGLEAPAAAQFPPITDRDYGIDLYQGGALGNLRIVGMGGAAVAIAEGSAGTLSNPAAPAVRPATSTDSWDWDWHLDYLSSVRSADWDNNGEAGGEGTGVGAITFGVAGMLGDWGLSLVGLTQTIDFRAIDPMTMEEHTLRASAIQGKLALARAFWQEQITVGLALRIGTFEFRDPASPVGDRQVFQVTGGSFEAGGIWRPWRKDLRVGAAIALPVSGRDPTINTDPTSCPSAQDCYGYILPERIEVPWQITLGAAWRFSPTEWNQWVGGYWRDEKALLVAADVVMTGWSPDAYGLEAFADRQLQRSGKHVVYSIRGGAEYEWVPGRLRVRAGSYWEPGRFEGVSGRIHGTFGLDVRVFQFNLWGWHRGRLSMTGDIASRYTNIGVSVGFWH